jgi:hypothetical protein
MMDEKEDGTERPISNLTKPPDQVKPDVSPQPVLKTQRRFYSKPFAKGSIMVSQINPVDHSATFVE